MAYPGVLLRFLLFVTMAGYGQHAGKHAGLRAGMVLGGETVDYQTYNKEATVIKGKYFLPEKNNCVLLYRFGAQDAVDPYDSLVKVVSAILQIYNSSVESSLNAVEAPTKFIFYALVKEINNDTWLRYFKITEQKNRITDSLVALYAYRKTCSVDIVLIKDSLKQASILAAGKVSVITGNGTLLNSSPVLKFVEQKKSKQKLIKGLLLTEKNGKKVPLANARVFLYHVGRTTADSSITNASGRFELLTFTEITDFNFEAKPESKEVNNIILATQTGQELMHLRRSEGNFEYKLIRADIVRLVKMHEKDISLSPAKRSK